MRLPLPAQAPSWLQGVLRAIENAFREIMPAPFRLKSYATADLPDAADFMGGLVFDSTTSTLTFSTGAAWSALSPITITTFGRSLVDDADAATARTTLGLGTAAVKNTGESGDAVPLLNIANTWSALQTYSAGYLSSSSTQGVGYTVGAGGSVTQITSKATEVTLNRPSGLITTHNASLAANSSVGFILNNASIAAGDIVVVHFQQAWGGSYRVAVDAVQSGKCRILIYNTTAGALSDAVTISFAVIKGATT